MSMKAILRQIARALGEAVVAVAANFYPKQAMMPGNPETIFILRNNDLGDVLVCTPLFETLKRSFPKSKIIAGIGPWAEEILKNNPNVDKILTVSAPWYNKFVMPQSFFRQVTYLLKNEDIAAVQAEKPDIGIDIVGTHWGSLFLMKAGIPFRLGVKGYSGGHSGTQRFIRYTPEETVPRAILRFAEVLGIQKISDPRPQIYLTQEEKLEGEKKWGALRTSHVRKRLVIGPGVGLEEKGWPVSHYQELMKLLSASQKFCMVIVGGKQDKKTGEALSACGPEIYDRTGTWNLRETFSIVASADCVVTSPSMLMHAAAAFSKPLTVLLGAAFPSAKNHYKQWGYEGACYHLGKEPGIHPEIYPPQEAADFILKTWADCSSAFKTTS